MTVRIKPRSHTYLFHGEAMRIIVLAKDPVMLTAREGVLKGEFCASKLSLERYSNFDGSEGNRENNWSPFV